MTVNRMFGEDPDKGLSAEELAAKYGVTPEQLIEMDAKLEAIASGFMQAGVDLYGNAYRPHYYIPDKDGQPVAVPLETWARWFENDFEGRIVARTYAIVRKRTAEISTIFLGMDHNHFGDGPPVLWETMIFGNNPAHDYQWRYSSREEAEKGHHAAVALAVMGLAWTGDAAPSKRRKRLCKRDGHPRPVQMASDGTRYCGRCGLVLSLGTTIKVDIAWDFERRRRKRSPKMERRERNWIRRTARESRRAMAARYGEES